MGGGRFFIGEEDFLLEFLYHYLIFFIFLSNYIYFFLNKFINNIKYNIIK